MIGIIDYGLGNLASVKNMLKKAGGKAIISSSPEALEKCDGYILPGVGAFRKGMEELEARGLVSFIQQLPATGKPLLGICLGAQLLTRHSEEGDVNGLGLIDAVTVRFPEDEQLKVPHMGWNHIHWKVADHPLATTSFSEPRYYFVHSYHMKCTNEANVLAECTYGVPFHAGIFSGKVIGLQFHPEKSHVFGLTLMKQFIAYVDADV